MAKKIYSISELNQIARGLLETRLTNIWINGEISNLAQPASGHLYFSLKDEQAQIRCAMFKNRKLRLRFQPENGMNILLRGTVSLYAQRGDYQFIVEEMQLAGEGALQQAFEALKQKLTSEGLFDESHKQPLPAFPKRLGIITSATGAAIHDVLSVLERRYPLLPILIFPVPVQGKGAEESIARAIKQAGNEKKCDVLLLTRGGGSLEDLWAFNEEIVARAIYDCPIPVVCGVGHEIDYSIADFVADVRAPTPSAAAEILSADGDELYNTFLQYQRYFPDLLLRQIHDRQQRVDWLDKRLQQQHPSQILQQQSQRTKALRQRLLLVYRNLLLGKRSILESSKNHLQKQSPAIKLAELRSQYKLLQQRFLNAITEKLRNRENQLGNAARALNMVSPLATLERGYAIVSHDENIINDTAKLNKGDLVNTRLAKGSFVSEVKTIRKK